MLETDTTHIKFDFGWECFMTKCRITTKNHFNCRQNKVINKVAGKIPTTSCYKTEDFPHKIPFSKGVCFVAKILLMYLSSN
jgi:hypothetical protein